MDYGLGIKHRHTYKTRTKHYGLGIKYRLGIKHGLGYEQAHTGCKLHPLSVLQAKATSSSPIFKKILASPQFNIFKTVLLYLLIHYYYYYCFYIPPIILYLLYFNVLVYYYFYFLFFYCDVYVCVCVFDINYPKQIVILAACSF